MGNWHITRGQIVKVIQAFRDIGVLLLGVPSSLVDNWEQIVQSLSAVRSLSLALYRRWPLTPAESHFVHSEGIESLFGWAHTGFGVTYIDSLAALFEAWWHIW